MYLSTSQDKYIECEKDLNEFMRNSSLELYGEDIMIDLLNTINNLEELNIESKVIHNLRLRLLFEIDSSTVLPKFEPLDSSSKLGESLVQEGFSSDENFDLEYDFYIKVFPVKSYNIKLRINKIEKAIPKIYFHNNNSNQD